MMHRLIHNHKGIWIIIFSLYRDDDDLSKVIMELIQKLMKTDQDTTSQEIITNFILYHHKQATSGISDKWWLQ